jgi:hypothetical protein
VDGKKNALIVIDGAESIRKMAADIAAVLENFTLVSVTANEFSGTDILSADICFFGSETSNPPSFTTLNTILHHINLAGKPCGVFSNSASGAEYLQNMVRDSELALYPVVLMEGRDDVKKWTKTIAAQLKKRQDIQAGTYGV